MRALIADDEPLLRAELREALARVWPELQVVAEAADGKQALAAALAQRPEIVFLDIRMPHLDGLGAARRLREAGFDGEIVFVTAYDHHALAAFDQRAIDYLVKPLEPERLGETVARLKSRLRGGAAAPVPAPATAPAPTPAPRWLRVTRGSETRLVAVSDIASFHAVPGYTQVLTREGVHLIEDSLKSVQAWVDPQLFLQVHRATIVNLQFIERILRERPGHCQIELKHGLGRIEVSRTGSELLRRL
ncbi:LytR/AlgR family response regulator transcription factor [Aquabacterium sp.]|uniref:LytR/AlgR family response regulator transcription factor n=1 Tax=Aquabacterium sp. TaxID=1872578 RepID=UPI003783DA4C